jgi:hypothetical protein
MVFNFRRIQEKCDTGKVIHKASVNYYGHSNLLVESVIRPVTLLNLCAELYAVESTKYFAIVYKLHTLKLA